MPIWSVSIYNVEFDFEPSRRGVVKANSEAEAAEIVKGKMGDAQRADITRQVVRDEGVFKDGYHEF